ncbi:hypothetical protein [Photorhabdus hainanensis]|nr:hypothetical protein [Photorhabdus hainanensis]
MMRMVVTVPSCSFADLGTGQTVTIVTIKSIVDCRFQIAFGRKPG